MNKNSVFFERLLQIIDYKEFKSVNDFAKNGLGYKASEKINRLKTEGNKPSIDIINDISNKFEDINIDWLRTGEGEMLKSSVAIVQDSENTVRLLPVSAQGGSLNDFVVSVRAVDCERIISPIKGADFAITVAGDSMFPEYPAGSQILIKKIDEKAFIAWGAVYVLDTCNGVVVKKLMPVKDNGNKVLCVSLNPDYPSFDVALADVYGIYRVMLCMAVKS